VDTYNAYLGLPRWRDVALCAGSTVGFQIEGDGLTDEEKGALLTRLEGIEREGLGLRRGEGFGQVVFNHVLYDKCESLGDLARIGLAGGGRRMRLATGGRDRALAVEDTFRRRWQAHLLDEQDEYQDDEADPFARQAFAALARLLRSESPASQEDVEALVERLGQPAELLPAVIRRELSVREKERGDLDFFRTGEAKPGLEALAELVVVLEQMADSVTRSLTGAARANTRRRCWRIGLDLLADRIAVAAGKEER
jgi:CRISPR-associated protein Csx10